MAIIYSYPTVVPTADDLVLGTDVNQTDKPTKNFTIQSIVDIVQGGATGLGAVLAISADALQQPATNFTNIQGSGAVTFGSFTDGTMNIVGGVGTGFSSFASTSFTGKLDATSFNQSNIRTLGILTGLQIANATPNVNLIDTTITAPGLDTSLVTEKAVVDYVATNPTSETLTEVLANGNQSGGVNSIDMTGAISNVTFIDSINPANPTSRAQGRATFGTGNDLQIYFDGTDGHIEQLNDAHLIISGKEIKIQTGQLGTPEDMIKAVSDGEVILYHNGTNRIQTSTTGVSVNGVIKASDGANNGPSYSFTSAANTGMYSPATNEIEFVTNGASRLKISSTGLGVTGAIDASGSIEGLSFTTDTTTSSALMTRFILSTDGIANFSNNTMVPTTQAVKEYADSAVGTSTLSYQGDAATAGTQPFSLNLATGTFDVTGGSNISTTSTAVAGNIGIITVNLDNAVTITGKMEAGTLSDGTFSGSAGTYTGGVSIESDLFVGDSTASTSPAVQFKGNASSANRLGLSNNTIQLSAGAGATLGVGSDAVIYTTGQAITLTTTLQSTTVTGKVLTGLPTPAAETVVAADTILEGFGKLQSQINGLANGLQFQGTWNASMDTGGTDNTPGGTPNLASGGGEASSGTTNATTASELVDSTKNFTTAPNIVAVGDKVINQVDGQTALVNSIANAASGRLGLASDIMLTGEAYIIDKSPFITAGHYYVVNAVGATTARNATLNGVQDWQIGDWVIASVTNVWQKLNNSAVEGAGTENRLPKWTAAVSTLVDSSVSDDGATIKLLNDTELGAAAGDAIKSVGVLTTDEQLILKKGLGVGSTPNYGTAGQVLTSGGGAASVNTWTTPTTGTVTSVGLTETGDALTITGSPITGNGTINIAGAGAAGSDQYINGFLNLVDFPTLDNYVNWKADSDEGTDITVTSGFKLKFAGVVTPGGAGISTDSAVEANVMTIGLVNAGGTPSTTSFYRGDGQWAVPVGTKTETLAEVLANDNNSGTNDIVMADNQKVTFGTVPDLQIYHDTAGGNSHIQTTSGSAGDLLIESQGTDHDLYLRATDDIYIQPQGNENGIKVIGDGAVELYHNSLEKLATTSAGVSVTGDVIIPQGALIASQTSVSSPVARFTNTDVNNYDFTFPDNSTLQLGANLGSDLVFKLLNAGAGDFNLDVGGDATFTGNVQIDGNLTVDGHIIHGGGGGGTGKGGQFTKLFTSISGGSTAFTIDRASTGAMVFDVMLTSDTSSTTSIAKKFTVVNTHGTANPIFNKILDTGPDTNGADFTVAFAADGTSNTKIKCTITPVTTATQKIGITIDLGFGQNNATVVMN